MHVRLVFQMTYVTYVVTKLCTASYPTLMCSFRWPLRHVHHQSVELVQEIGRRTANITGDVREFTFLFQQLSVALQRGNAVSFQNTFTTS